MDWPGSASVFSQRSWWRSWGGKSLCWRCCPITDIAEEKRWMDGWGWSPHLLNHIVHIHFFIYLLFLIAIKQNKYQTYKQKSRIRDQNKQKGTYIGNTLIRRKWGDHPQVCLQSITTFGHLVLFLLWYIQHLEMITNGTEGSKIQNFLPHQLFCFLCFFRFENNIQFHKKMVMHKALV